MSTTWEPNLLTMDKAVAYFKFLYCLPIVDIATLDPDKQDCPFCFEPYNQKAWEWGDAEVLNHPVRLACGHIFGFECLTTWLFSPNFNNFCPYCRIPLIIKAHRSQDKTFKMLKQALELRQLLNLQSSQEAESFMKLLGDTCIIPAKDQNRIMIMFEEYLKDGAAAVPKLAPLTWRELAWWSPETNAFTAAVIIATVLIMLVASLVYLYTKLFLPLASVIMSKLMEQRVTLECLRCIPQGYIREGLGYLWRCMLPFLRW